MDEETFEKMSDLIIRFEGFRDWYKDEIEGHPDDVALLTEVAENFLLVLCASKVLSETKAA